MKRRSKKPAPVLSARVMVTELPRNLEEVYARSDAIALADNLYKRAIENGEPVSPDMARYISERSPAAGKLVAAIPVIQTEKKRTAKLRAKNQEKQGKAASDHRFYYETAVRLHSENPHLLRTRNKLARRTHAELVRQGKIVSVKTVLRAIVRQTPKNK